MKLPITDIIKPDASDRKVLKWESFLYLRENSVWQSILNDDELEIALDDVDFINHDGMVWISYICLHRRLKNLDTYIYLPDNKGQIAFLKLIKFADLRTFLDFQIPNEYYLDFTGTDKYDRLSNIQRDIRKLYFVYPDNWARVSSKINIVLNNYLIEELEISRTGEEAFEYLNPFLTTLRELLHNIVLHAGLKPAEGMGIVSFNPYPREFKKIRYCCSDAGVGIRETLKRTHNIECENDSDALIKAFLVRAIRKETGILGLYKTLDFIRNKHGTIGVISGSAFLKIDFSGQQIRNKFDKLKSNISLNGLKEICKFEDYPSISGTHIYVDLNYK